MLAAEAWVLDLGSSTGSFDRAVTPAHVVRLDLAPRNQADASPFVQADASALPFPSHCFDVVIANHCLEHIVPLDAAIHEIGRVVKQDGSLMVSVPDASTITDKVYRWLGKGGGHVNAFTDASHLQARLSGATGLAHVGTVCLYSGLSFLNRKNMRRVQKKMLLLGGGNERLLMLATLFFRWVDWKFGSRLSVYGWAFYFGKHQPSSLAAHENVCVGCGFGISARELAGSGCLRGSFPAPVYVCANCGSGNYYTAWCAL